MPTTLMLRDLSARFGCAVQAFRTGPTPHSVRYRQTADTPLLERARSLPTRPVPSIEAAATPTTQAINLYPARQS